MTAPALERRTFSVSRAADFLEQRALETQTGQPRQRFGWVCVKELIDNALDAAESAGVSPDITVTVEHPDEDTQLLTVTDNGAGIPPEVVARILDFGTYTSDKALYRSPTRGLQGNALKTVLGIPYALEVIYPVVIEARGVRHEIALSLDAARNLRTGYSTPEGSWRTAGTSVTVPLPAGLDIDADAWVAQYALVNPHAAFTVAEHAHGDEPEVGETYKATAQDGWRKPRPTDKTSAWWYQPAEFSALACSLAAAGDDRPVGTFIREDFKNLSSTAKAREIAAAAPGVRRIADLADDDPHAALILLLAMQRASKIPQAAYLGKVPPEHFEELLDCLYGVERFWYKHGGTVDDAGVAWHLEAAVAETSEPGAVTWATNYAVSFGDPLGATDLRTADVFATGARSFLSTCDAVPMYGNGHLRAAVVHVTCASPRMLDKGKTQLVVPDEVAAEFSKVLWGAGKELHRERESAHRAEERQQAARRRMADAADRAERAEHAADRRREREARSADRRANRITVREAVFAAIPQAVDQVRAGTDLPFSAHSLFYKIRPLALQLLPEGTVLRAPYVEGTLLPEYERAHGRIPKMYREPRGELHEPHRGQVVPLGTLQVEAYQPPDWSYDKVLVVEKAGLRPVLIESGIGDRFDMAIASCDGFGSEATRTLLARLVCRDVTVFVLHDADHSGYNIALTLAEETARMPDHRIEIVDLGLTVADALERELEPEPYTRESALPARLEPRLAEAERDWFGDSRVASRNLEGKPEAWDCQRVELNAFSSPGLVAYLEAKLRAAGATARVIPPGRRLRDYGWDAYDSMVSQRVTEAIILLLDTDEITREVQKIARRRARMKITPRTVRRSLRDRPQRSWRDAASSTAAGQLHVSGLDIDPIVRRLVLDQLRRMDGEP